MIIMFKVVVAVGGTPGPVLGDGVKTTVTMLMPATLTEAGDTLGSRVSVINSTTRKNFGVARVYFYPLRSNNTVVAVGAQGVATADTIAIPVSLPEALSPTTLVPVTFGNGITESVNLGDFDVDVDTGGEGILVVAEMV